MTLRTNSQAFRPRYQSAPYKPSPARRKAIYGPVHDMEREDRTAPYFVWLGMAVCSWFAAAVIMGAAQ